MNLKNILKILLLLSLSACSNIQIPNEPVCADISQTSGYCVKMVSGESYEISGEQWLSFNKKALKISPDSYAQIKILILKLCKKSKDCNVNQLQEHLNKAEKALN